MAPWKKLLTLSVLPLGLAGVVAPEAHAGLIGAGRTVQAFYYNGTLAGPEGEIPVGASTTDPASLAAAVDYQQGLLDGSTIHVGDVMISITNLLSGFPFCVAGNPGTSCPDQIDGFDFKFTGEDITGVKLDPASAADFQPVTGTFQGNLHSGLQLISNNEIRVDVTGDEPIANDQLILDLSFGGGGGGTPVPEPASLLLLGAALAGFAGRRIIGPGRKAPVA